MKNYKNYLVEHKKIETLGDRLRAAYESDNQKEIEKLIGFDKEYDFDYQINFKKEINYDNGWELSEIELFCNSMEFDDYSGIESMYIGSYSDMRTYGYEFITELEELNYQFVDENKKLLKDIFSMFDFEWKDDDYDVFFRLNTKIISDLTDELKWSAETGMEETKKEEAFKYYYKFYDNGFEIDGINNKDYSLKITIIIDELPDVESFDKILSKYFDDFAEIERLTYSTTMNNKEWNKKEKKYNNILKIFINDLKTDIGNDDIITYESFKKYFNKELFNTLDRTIIYGFNELDYLKVLGGKIYNEYIKRYEWQESYIETGKKIDRYNNLIKAKIINSEIKKKYAHVVAAKKFKI